MNSDNLHIFGMIANHITMLANDPDNAEYCGAASLSMAKSFARCYGSHPNSNAFRNGMSDAQTNLRLLKAKLSSK